MQGFNAFKVYSILLLSEGEVDIQVLKVFSIFIKAFDRERGWQTISGA